MDSTSSGGLGTTSVQSNDHPVVFEFGVERYEIAAVPEEVKQPRLDVGHYHLGVESECLPVGEITPQGRPVGALR